MLAGSSPALRSLSVLCCEIADAARSMQFAVEGLAPS